MIELRWHNDSNNKRVLQYRVLSFHIDAGGAVNAAGSSWSDWMEVVGPPEQYFQCSLCQRTNSLATQAARLKFERNRLSLTQYATADIGGIKRSAQCNYEADKRNPSATYLEGLARAGFDIQYIVTGVASTNLNAVIEHLNQKIIPGDENDCAKN